MKFVTKYRIERGSTTGDRTSIYDATLYEDIIQRIVGIYDCLEEARKQIPDDWVKDPHTDADIDKEDYYEPGTAKEEMDGHWVLVSITVVEALADEDD
jgi:hypothetical protein